MPTTALDPATMAATPTKKAAKKKASGKATALQAELKRQAELFLLGQNLLEEIAGRDALEGRPPYVADHEWQMLEVSSVFNGQPKVFAESLRDRSQHALFRLVQSVKGPHQMRRRLKELPTVAQSEKNIVEAEANEAKAVAALEILDGANLEPESLEKIKAISSQLRQYRTQRVEAEATLEQVRSLRHSLSLKAPHPLRQKVDNEKHAVPNKIELGGLRNELSSIEYCISPNGMDRVSVNNGNLDGFIKTYCPESIIQESRSSGLKIDRDKLGNCVNTIRAELIPDIKNRIETMQAEVDAAMLEADKPLQKWVDDGLLTIEMLLN